MQDQICSLTNKLVKDIIDISCAYPNTSSTSIYYVWMTSSIHSNISSITKKRKRKSCFPLLLQFPSVYFSGYVKTNIQTFCLPFLSFSFFGTVCVCVEGVEGGPEHIRPMTKHALSKMWVLPPWHPVKYILTESIYNLEQD